MGTVEAMSLGCMKPFHAAVSEEGIMMVYPRIKHPTNLFGLHEALSHEACRSMIH